MRKSKPILFSLTLSSIVIWLKNILNVGFATGLQQRESANILKKSSQEPVCRIDFSALTLGQSFSYGGLG